MRPPAFAPTRRTFLKGAALAALAPAAVARRALARPAPSERVVLGCIGVGGMGTANMNAFLACPDVEVVAVCDVDAKHCAAAKARVEKQYSGTSKSGTYAGCAEFGDFRELLSRPDIDAVMIGTPDHWHALVTIAAARAGKDAYCEKPLSLTIAEGRAMSDVVHRHARVFQTGSQQRSSRDFRFACELARNGRLGKLQRILVGLPTGPAIDATQPAPVPPELDYDFWLGPAPDAPYAEGRCHGSFRWIYDYSGGQITDWGAHHLDIAQWGHGSERSGPVRVRGTAEYPKTGLFDTPTNYRFEAEYADGVVLDATNARENGVRFEGERGWVFVNRERIDAEPKSLLSETFAPNEPRLFASDDHHRNFLDCVRSRRDPIAPIEEAHRSITIAHLANIAMRLGREVKWDAARERIEGDETAARMTSRAMRGGWTL